MVWTVLGVASDKSRAAEIPLLLWVKEAKVSDVVEVFRSGPYRPDPVDLGEVNPSCPCYQQLS